MTPTTERRLRLGTGVALALFLLPAGPALAVECGAEITAFARLDRDLICTTDPALTVRGGKLDLNGFAVVCDQTDVGIRIEGRGAHLRGGAVTGCVVAVWVGGTGRHLVWGVTASASNQGVFIESDRNGLLHSHVLRGRDDAAVQVDGSNNHLSFNNVAGSLDQGFEINGNNNRIIGNRIAAVAEGVQLVGNGNHVLRNQIIGTTARGVEVRAGAHVIKDNLIADGDLDGIALLVNANGNEVSQNRIYGHGDQGLFVGTLNNRLLRNQVLLNAIDVQDNTADCDNNLWQDNVFEIAVSDTDCIE
jgi:hypothetical protein